MQSTGHGGRHNSQPVHCAAITVWASFVRADDRVDRAGRACSARSRCTASSSIHATCRGLRRADRRIERSRLASQQRGERADRRVAARRAAVDVRLARARSPAA